MLAMTAGRVALAVLPALILAGVARAELVVVQSSAPALRAGVTLADDAAVDIPHGKSALFVLPNGSTRTVTGPFTGKAADLTKGVAVDRELLSAVQRYVTTGGASASRVGATRSAARAAQPPADAARFLGWDTLAISAVGDQCLAGRSTPKLYRPSATADLTVTVVDLATSRRAVVVFKTGSRTAPWPADFMPATGANYAIAAPERALTRFVLRLIDPVPRSEDTLRVLHGQRCIAQMQAWLGSLMQQAAAPQ